MYVWQPCIEYESIIILLEVWVSWFNICCGMQIKYSSLRSAENICLFSEHSAITYSLNNL